MTHLLAVLMVLASSAASAETECSWQKTDTFSHAELGDIPVYRDPDRAAIAFSSRMHVNPDGAPDAYHPDNIGTVHICNGISVGQSCKWKPDCMEEFEQARTAGFSGTPKICFFAMATDSSGRPIVQGDGDPQPGYFVSTTALKHTGKDPKRPSGQLDSNVIPFAVIPKQWSPKGAVAPKLGDIGVAYRKSNAKLAYFVVGDIGPKSKLGEGSIALHQALGNDPFMVRYGVRRAFRSISTRDVVYLIFSGSADPSRALTEESIRTAGHARLSKSGGEEMLVACATKL